jgi:TatD DNase family protein
MYLKKHSGSEYDNFINELNACISEGSTITDTHSHIHFQEFTNDFDSMLERSKLNGVNRIITVGINYEDSLEAFNLAERYNEVYFAAGVHPSEAHTFHKDNHFEPLLLDDKCVAIGEIGLDYYRNGTSKALQKDILNDFLKKAIYINKPVIIHSREATPDLLNILNDFIKDKKLKGVFHCFNGDKDLLSWGITHGFYFSFTGNITYPKSYDLRAILKNIPENKIMLESDCPYLTPMPFRGNRNEPSYIIYTLYTICKAKSLSLRDTLALLEENVQEFFNF